MLFKHDSNALTDKGATFTVSEIKQQPNTWLKTFNIIENQKEEIANFLDEVFNHPTFKVILSGAGTSEFVGNTLLDFLRPLAHNRVESIATTHLVSNPELYFEKNVPTLLVSFARSGNSPESLGAVDAAEKLVDTLYHMTVTCNAEGKLAKFESDHSKILSILLPEETNDKSLAMTSSFSNMVLATYLAFSVNTLAKQKPLVEELAKQGNVYLEEMSQQVETLFDELKVQRVVYLGSNSLRGIAQECSLKMLELTAGKIATLHDTFLGFRHGPKSFLIEGSMTVAFTSSNSYTQLYEKDLVDSLPKPYLVVTTSNQLEKYNDADNLLVFDTQLPDIYLGLLYAMIGQTMAVLESMRSGLQPDAPSPTGLISRVVQGVTLYPVEGK